VGDCHERRKVSIRAFLLHDFINESRRYVSELLKMRETFIIPLLHPHAISSSSTMIEYDDMSQVETLVDSLDQLPIASRFLSPPAAKSDDTKDDSQTSRQGGQGNPNLVEPDPRSPLACRTPRGSFVSLSRSYKSRRAPRANRNAVFIAPSGPGSFVDPSPTKNDLDRGCKSPSTGPSARRIQAKPKESFTKVDLIAGGGVAPHQIPENLRQCLEVIEDSILQGHIRLCEGLRKRYDGQYPLVRSLTDLFLANVRFLILFPYRSEPRLTLALVTHPSELYELCSASRTSPRASQRRYYNRHLNQSF
jgi:hypothetical protein